MSVVEAIGCLLLALGCGLDRTAFLQIMISRPVVAAPMLGWWLGQPLLGVQIGLVLELVFLARLPVGATVPQDDTQMALGATLVATLAVRLQSFGPTEAAALGLLLALSVGSVGGWLDRLVRYRNATLAEVACVMVAQGNHERLLLVQLQGLLHFMAASALTFVVTGASGAMVLSVWGHLIRSWIEPMAAFIWLLPLCGVAGFLAQHRGRDYSLLYAAGFLGTLVALTLMA